MKLPVDFLNTGQLRHRAQGLNVSLRQGNEFLRAGHSLQDNQMPQTFKQRTGNPCGFMPLGLQQSHGVQCRGSILLA